MKKNHVLIIGAGIAGLSAAYYLQKAGMEITVLDKENGENNCSCGNAGMVVPSHIIPLASPGIIGKGLKWMLNAESPFYIKPRLEKELLSWGWKFRKASTRKHVEESAPLLKELLLTNRALLVDLEEKEQLKFGFQKKGLLMLCKSEEGMDEEMKVADKANSLGIPAQILSAEETRKMEPNIEMDILGSVYFPLDSHFHPASLMNQLKAKLKDRGVRFRYQTEVTGLQAKGDKVAGVVLKDQQVLEGSHVVICSGVWSSVLVRDLNVRLPMQAGKGYSITLDKPRSLPTICALLSEAKVSMTPMLEQLRFGGTMEIVGFDTSINKVKLNALKRSVCSYFPEYTMDDFDGKNVWVGLRPLSPDGLPYVGVLGKYNNLYVSTGHAMMGMSLGLVSGRIVSNLVLQKPDELAHPLIDPDRYS